MKLIKGNLWDFKDEAILVTCNSYIRKDGEVVMGRGAALEFKERFPLLPIIFGDQISRHYGALKKYGILLSSISGYTFRSGQKYLGLFQVKYHFKNPADISLIEFSTNGLMKFIKDIPLNSVSMNFPGVGYGRLQRELILPIIEKLPDNVSIYERE
jgi:hypothetical protein